MRAISTLHAVLRGGSQAGIASPGKGTGVALARPPGLSGHANSDAKID
jgi:hypothetical protein